MRQAGLYGMSIVIYTHILIHVCVCVCVCVWTVMALPLAQPLNILCAQHWPSLATQPYFDPQGFFAFVFWGGPLLLLAIGVLVRLIIRLFQLMILMKRRQLRASQQRWETQPQQTAGDDSSPAANLVKE